MTPPDDLLRKLYGALVHTDEDRDTFNDAFLWMHRHPCAESEYEHRFVTRFYFLRKDRWTIASHFVPIGNAALVQACDACEEDEDNIAVAREEDFINELKYAIHQETHKNGKPKEKGKGRFEPSR